jgi:anti-sigma factor RsiW
MSVSNNNLNVDELLSAYIDGELTDAERAQVEKRLAADPAARELVAELRGLSNTLRSLPHEKMPADMRPDVMNQIRDKHVVLPRSEISLARRLMWPALAIAAALLLMFVQDNGERREPEIAKVEVGGGELRDAAGPERADPAFEAPAPVAVPATVVEPVIDAAAAPAEGMAVDESLRERDLEADAAAEPSQAVDRALDALATADAELGIVHLTLTDLRSGAERFDRLLLSNGVQVIDESAVAGRVATNGVTAESSVSDGAPSASTFSTRSAGGLGGAAAPPANLPVTSGLEGEEKSELGPESEMVLVEAPPEQIKQILATCSQDTEAIEEVTIDPSASGTNSVPEKQRLTEYQQYARSAGKKTDANGYAITSAQQGVIEALNSLPKQQAEPPFPREAVAGVQEQGWATKLRSTQQPADLRQIEVEVNQRRGQFYGYIPQQSGKLDKKLAKDKEANQQPMRVLFLLHPSADAAKK